MEGRYPVKPLASFEVRSSTPMLLGGYDGCACHGDDLGCEPLRSQSLKGALRWWSRAALAGALYSRGVNGRDLIKGVKDASGSLWGSTGHVSSMILRTHGTVRRYSCARINGHSRYRLVNLGRSSRECDLCGWLEGGSIYLSTLSWRGLPESYVNHAIFSLITLLWLGGLGKGSRRGLGSLDIRDWKYVVSRYVNNILDTLKRLVSSSSSIVSRSATGGSGGGLPVVPAIASGVFRLYKCRVGDPVRAATEFSRAVLRPRLPIRHGAWIFGLPRRGYRAGVERRASPIMFSAHRGVGFISAFYSSDWPREIRHGDYRVVVTDEVVREHMDAALEYVVGVLGQRGIRCEEVRIW